MALKIFVNDGARHSRIKDHVSHNSYRKMNFGNDKGCLMIHFWHICKTLDDFWMLLGIWEFLVPWKLANIVLTLKKGKKEDLVNYRPHSVSLQWLVKIMEKIIQGGVGKHLEDNTTRDLWEEGPAYQAWFAFMTR